MSAQDTINMLSDQVTEMISLAQNAQTATVRVAQAASHKGTPIEDTAAAKRRLKLKELIDQVNEDKFEPLPDMEVAACVGRYEVVMGQDEVPPSGEEPTEEQLSAIAFMLKAGLNPYADSAFLGHTCSVS